MRSKPIIILLVSLIASTLASDTVDCTPTQIHLSLGDSYYLASRPDDLALPSEIFNHNQAYLVWNTKDACNFSVSLIGTDNKTNATTAPVAYSTVFDYDFVEANHTKNNGTYHSIAYTVLLKDLVYGALYQYSILDEQGTVVAGPFKLRLPEIQATQKPRKVVLMGDLDTKQRGNLTIDQITDMMNTDYDEYAGIIHLGDLAYNLEDDNGTRGDSFYDAIQPFAAVSPFIISPGNHETYANFSFLNFRLRDPLYNMTHNHYFSFNLEGIHFVSINYDFYTTTTAELQEKMFNWIEADLKEANTPANRAKWQWVVVVSHRPMYCLENGLNIPEVKRCYTFYESMKKWDELFHTHQVDMMIAGHTHAYERLGPIYQNKTVPHAGDNHTVTDPGATLYIVEAVGGQGEAPDAIYKPSGYGSFVDFNPGYGLLYSKNTSDGYYTLVYEHFTSDAEEMIDHISLRRSIQAPAVPETTVGTPAGFGAILVKIFLFAIVVAIAIAGLKYWKKRKSDPENEQLTDGSKWSKRYGKRYGENNISMVDLVL